MKQDITIHYDVFKLAILQSLTTIESLNLYEICFGQKGERILEY